MIRTLETACNNNILHPVLLHKPFLSLSFGVDSQGYGDNSKGLRR